MWYLSTLISVVNIGTKVLYSCPDTYLPPGILVGTHWIFKINTYLRKRSAQHIHRPHHTLNSISDFYV